MSTELRPMVNTGSRNVELKVTRYWGGPKGVCFQLTGQTEEGGIGYVQLSKRDIYNLYRRVKGQSKCQRKNKA